MRKFCLFFFLLVVCFFFVGCSFEKRFNEEISEYHQCLYSAEDENFFITFSVGKREEPYVVDGQNNPLVDFAVLTAYKQNLNLLNHVASFNLNHNNKTLSGRFEVNPFDNSFVIDLGNIGLDFGNLNVEIIADGKSYNYKLENQLGEDEASFSEVKKIAESQFKPVKNKIMQNNQMSAEVYYRLIKKGGNPPLWYVSVVCKNGDLFAIIIEPKTRDVIAKKL